jgi:hypothetical protein
VPGIFVGYDEGSKAYKFMQDGCTKWRPVRTLNFNEHSFGWQKRNLDSDIELMTAVPVNEQGDREPCVMAGEPKDAQRVELKAAKETARTRQQLQKMRSQPATALISVDSFGGEWHVDNTIMQEFVPKSVKQARECAESQQWELAMHEEIEAMEAAGVWGPPVSVPAGTTITPLKFIFTKKMGPDGNVARFKARLIYLNRSVSDSNDDSMPEESFYAPVVDKASMRAFLTYAASRKWFLEQADVRTAFLHAENSGEDYVLLPEGFGDGSGRLRKLHKALYGLRRAPKAWNETFAKWATGEAFFVQSDVDPCLLFRNDREGSLIIYVDDLLLAASSKRIMDDMLSLIDRKFSLRKLGQPEFFLGMNLLYDRLEGRLVLSQFTYIRAMMNKFDTGNAFCKGLPMVPETILLKDQAGTSPTDQPYGSLVGALLFVSVSTRPDVSYAVNRLSKFVSSPSVQHWDAAVQVLLYLYKTKFKGICLGFEHQGCPKLLGYTDSDWANDVEDRKSISGGVVLWGGSLLAWYSRKQTMVATSTTEAETIAAVDMAYSLLSTTKLITEIAGIKCGDLEVSMLVDNQPSIHSMYNGRGRNRHYDVKLKFIQECVLNSHFTIQKVQSDDNLADMLTKALRKKKFDFLSSVFMQDQITKDVI